MYLVDTNVISAAASRKTAPPDLLAWMDAHSNALFLSAITIAEIEDGIAKLQREGARRKAAELSAWLEILLHLYTTRILAFDVQVARIAGALSDVARSAGIAPGFADIAIGATARHHGLKILTRNLRHFAPLGIPTQDPFTQTPTP